MRRCLLALFLIVASMVGSPGIAQPETAPGGTVVLRGNPQVSPNVVVPPPPGNQPTTALPSRGGWDRNYDITGFDRRAYDATGYDRRYDTKGIDQSFNRNFDTTGFDRRFDRP